RVGAEREGGLDGIWVWRDANPDGRRARLRGGCGRHTRDDAIHVVEAERIAQLAWPERGAHDAAVVGRTAGAVVQRRVTARFVEREMNRETRRGAAEWDEVARAVHVLRRAADLVNDERARRRKAVGADRVLRAWAVGAGLPEARRIVCRVLEVSALQLEL